MIQVTPHMRILVAVEPADFRRGIDGLARVCREVLHRDPFSGWVFVFRNRRAKAIKILVYDGQGFWLCQKRLCQGRFRWWPERDGNAGGASASGAALGWRSGRGQGRSGVAAGGSAGVRKNPARGLAFRAHALRMLRSMAELLKYRGRDGDGGRCGLPAGPHRAQPHRQPVGHFPVWPARPGTGSSPTGRCATWSVAG